MAEREREDRSVDNIRKIQTVVEPKEREYWIKGKKTDKGRLKEGKKLSFRE